MSDKQVRLGVRGPVVGAQGLGCMGMSEFYGPTDQDEARRTLEHALERGVTLFDTADMYGMGANEEFLSPFVNAHRDEVTLATKFGIVRDPADPGRREMRGDAEYVRSAAEASLRRLGVDVIDLYYMHRRDLSVPIEETVGAMAELVQAGKVRHLGLSEVTAGELRAASAVHPIAAVQSEWSVFNRDVEKAVVPAAAELGVGFVPYSPLGRGFLTGAFTDAAKLGDGDVREIFPQYTGDNAGHNVTLLEPIRRIAERDGVTMAQVALAWVHARGRVHGLGVVPIPGTRRRTRLDENVAALGLDLSTEDLAELEAIAGQVQGTRYADISFVSAGRE
ncbi:aldo/keto reductase [Saccharopolyspora erythraea]|uniref:aldo/keto reductase n=1 Tax=Saccharopolyspora erythraea TaxID=1836 RepID=UPI001BA6040E|nr:aldo/keto reductase [Saccharopolyspora erythraea]QUH05379.1 aldo/keto reductase [Saccharopolyspora erythraea]